MKCIVCGTSYDNTVAGSRENTCSEPCHKEYVNTMVEYFGEYKPVVDLTTGKKYKVRTRDILEIGINQENLKSFPIWED